MFDIYIKNFNQRDGTYVTSETLLYSIPMDPDEENILNEPKVICEMGKAGSFEFSMNPGHPYYEALRQMKTIFRIVYDGSTIFRGRVLTIDAGHMSGLKKVHCEGDLAFLLDSQIEGKADKDRPKTNALTYLQGILAEHNAQMANDMADKRFLLGEVPGQYTSAITTPQRVNPDANYQYGSTSWRDAQSAFIDLSDSFGGYWRTRYQNGSVYLDWLDSFYNPTVNTQPIEIGENLLDITSSSEVNNIFTALIPVGSKNGKNLYITNYRTDIHGSNNFILVPQILSVFTDEQLNSGFHSKQDYANAITNYGYVFKTESFSNADTQEKLWNYATDWIKNNYCGGIASFSISAVDMHAVGEPVGKYLVGDRVQVIYPDIDQRDTDPTAMIQKTLTIMKAEYQLYNPEKNNYTIGIPNAILKRNYGEKSTKKKASSGSGNNKQDKTEEKIIHLQNVTDEYVWTFVIDGYHNTPEYEAYKQKYGQEAADKVLKAAYVGVGQVLDADAGGASTARMLHKTFIDGDKIELSGPYDPALKPLIEQGRDVTQKVIIGALTSETAQTSGFEIKPPTPIEALAWGDVQFMGWKNIKAVKIAAKDDGGRLELGKVTGQTTTSAGTDLPTVVADAGKGAVAGVKASFAESFEQVKDVIDGDATGNIQLDGELTEITGGFTDGGTGDFKKTFLFNGSSDTGGEGGIGIDLENPLGDFLVKLNDKVTYKDKDGQTHTAEPGFVTAKDFGLTDKDEIPSFKTKMAVIDQAFIGVVYTNQLNAVEAKIDKITGKSIVAESVVRTDRFSAHTANIDHSLTAPDGAFSLQDRSGTSYYLSMIPVSCPGLAQNSLYIPGSGSANGLAIPDAVSGFGQAQPSGGSISIPYYTNSGGSSTPAGSINFNIADTEFYQNSVGIASISDWLWDSDKNRYSALVTPNDSESPTSDVLLPAIYLGGSSFDEKHKAYVYAYGPQDSGGTRHAVASRYEVNGTDLYKSGQNSVNVVGGAWSGGQKTFSPSVGTGTGQTVQLSKGTESWEGNICTFQIMDSQGSGGQSPTSTGYNCTVDITNHLPSTVLVEDGWSWETATSRYKNLVHTDDEKSSEEVLLPAFTTGASNGGREWDDSKWTQTINAYVKGPADSEDVTHDIVPPIAITISEDWRERVSADDGKSLSMTIKFKNGNALLDTLTLSGIGTSVYQNGRVDGIAEGTKTGRRLGWNAAVERVSVPTSKNTDSDTISVLIPDKVPAGSTSTEDRTSYQYQVSCDKNYCYIHYLVDDDGVEVARAVNTATASPLCPMSTDTMQFVGYEKSTDPRQTMPTSKPVYGQQRRRVEGQCWFIDNDGLWHYARNYMFTVPKENCSDSTYNSQYGSLAWITNTGAITYLKKDTLYRMT